MIKYEGGYQPDAEDDDYAYYLGHTQAPTSAQREWTEDTSHPFEIGDWIVAHNGVLTNDKELNSKYTPWNCNPVDTAVIPAMLNEMSNDDNNMPEHDIICEVLKRLKGTYGLWIYNILSGNVYLARQGSTLFADIYTNNFSSAKGSNYKPLEEGILYILTPEGITQIASFGYNSPFFTI